MAQWRSFSRTKLTVGKFRKPPCKAGMGRKTSARYGDASSSSASSMSQAKDISYLHSDGCLLSHSLVHADEGYVVV